MTTALSSGPQTTGVDTRAGLYLGLDLGAKFAHFAATRDGQVFQQGTVTHEDFPSLLLRLSPTAVGMEYSGRLAEPWFLTCFAKDTPAFIMHSVLRKSITRLQRQTAKTDAKDAESIARTLRLWHRHDLRRELGLPLDLFTNAEETRTAWVLRALLADAEAHQKTRVAAKLRYAAAYRMGMPERAALWAEAVKNDMPERSFAIAQEYCLTHFTTEYDLLTGIPHIGPKTALILIANLLPIDRFEEVGARGSDRTVRNIKRYVGLHNNLSQSGSTINEAGERTGNGDRRLRSSLTICARSVAHPKASPSPFLRLYKRLTIEQHMKPGKALNRVSTALLRVAIAVLRTGQPFYDPEAPIKEVTPDYLVTQSEAARALGISRQRIHQLITTGKLRTETHGKKAFVIRRYLDVLQDQRKEQKKK